MEIKTENIQEYLTYNGSPVRDQFPSLNQMVYGKPLVYLDNAATTQKPWKVINAIQEYYTTINSNIHRGVHYLSQKATDAYEVSRNSVAEFINARNSREIIFTRGTTEGINLVADCFSRYGISEKDLIIISSFEHQNMK